MATIFPGSASVGQIFDGYSFNGTAWDIVGIDLTADYLETSTASATYLNKVSASNTYLTQVSASTTYATKTELNNIDLSSASAAAVAAIVDSAPSTLNTLNELAAALGDDANYASTITTALGNKLDISSASTTYATKTELNNIDALPSQSGNSGKYLTTSGSVASWGTLDLSTYAPIVDPVFTDDIQVDGQINLAMSGSVATSYISSFDDLFAGGPSTKLLGRYVQVETDVVDDQFSRISLQPGIISIVASGESSYVALSGASGQYINSFDPANQIATVGNLSTYLTQSSASSNYLTKTSASSTYLTQVNASTTYAPIVSPVFTGDIQVDGQVNLLMDGATPTAYIYTYYDGFAGGPAVNLLGRTVQIETDYVDGNNAQVIMQPGSFEIIAGGTSPVIISGAGGEYINSYGASNQIATIGDITSADSDQAIIAAQVFG